MTNKKLIWGLIVSSLLLVYFTFKREYDHKQDLKRQTEIVYTIGCLEGSYNVMRIRSPDSQFFTMFCKEMSRQRDMSQLMEFVEDIKLNQDDKKEIMIHGE